MEAVINSSFDGIFITDGQGIVLAANKAYERITGIKIDEVRGKSMKRLVNEHYYDQSVTLMVMQGKASVTINQIVKGNRRVLVTGNPVFDDQGNLIRIVTNVRDISELVNLQDQLAETREQTLKYEKEISHLRSLQVTDKDLVYRSKAMALTVELATKVSDVNSTILITGESGTGKELVAQLIHRQGKGPAKPFIKINCAAIPEQLLESELFGYESGAFTGASKKGKPGLFELAQHGTLFLDEVADLPLPLQGKILRAIQEKEIMRLGGSEPIKVDVRIVAATHREIADMVKTGSFRRDLYYRLMVVPLHIAPLRERKEDIPLLIKYFIDKFNEQFGYQKRITQAAIDKLIEYSWPGNIRELENLIERMMVTAWANELTVDLMPEQIGKKVFKPQLGTKLKTAVEQTEAYLLTEAFNEYASWPKVAEVLGVDRATVFRKVAKYGLINNKNR
jgi:PAS domain S-box-containing protein